MKLKIEKKKIFIILAVIILSFFAILFFYFQFKRNVSMIVCEYKKVRIEHRWNNTSNSNYYVTQDAAKDYQNLIIDDNFKKLARIENGSKNIIQGDYKVFSKNKIEVIETRNAGKDTVVVTFLIDRISGTAEFYIENNSANISKNILGGVSKVRLFANCQKLKNNTL
jgi:hypothetical protein